MALRLHILGPANIGVVGFFSFYPGEDRVLRMQVVDEDTGNPYPIPGGDGTTLTVTLAGTPDDVVVTNESVNIDSDDASVVIVPLTDTQTSKMITGEIKLKIDIAQDDMENPVLTRLAVAELGLKKFTTLV